MRYTNPRLLYFTYLKTEKISLTFFDGVYIASMKQFYKKNYRIY